jgi:ribosome-associated heat shock protein Hsp15
MNAVQAAESVRVDVWLWCVRLCPTRSAATDACRGGHVRVNGRPAKPATVVRPGDRIEAHLFERNRVIEVVTLLTKRVGAPIAVECYVDHSPKPPEQGDEPLFAARDAGTGRPTKKDRRQIDRMRRLLG